MRVAVFGAGALGSYFGGRLAQGGADVWFIARGRQLEALRDHGLRIVSPLGDVRIAASVVPDPVDVGPVDLVLFTVKSFDTAEAAPRLRALLGPSTAVLSLQNGIDNEDRIGEAIGLDHVIGGAAFVFATVREPGVVEQTGTRAQIVFGELDGARTPRTSAIAAALSAGGVEAVVSPNIRGELWKKFAFICAVAGMTATARLPLGVVREDAAASQMFEAILEEVVAVARAEDVAMDQDVTDRLMHLARAQARDSYSSLYADLINGRRIELEALHGEVLRRAATCGLDVPASQAVYAILRPWVRVERGPRQLTPILR